MFFGNFPSFLLAARPTFVLFGNFSSLFFNNRRILIEVNILLSYQSSESFREGIVHGVFQMVKAFDPPPPNCSKFKSHHTSSVRTVQMKNHSVEQRMVFFMNSRKVQNTKVYMSLIPFFILLLKLYLICLKPLSSQSISMSNKFKLNMLALSSLTRRDMFAKAIEISSRFPAIKRELTSCKHNHRTTSKH